MGLEIKDIKHGNGSVAKEVEETIYEHFGKRKVGVRVVGYEGKENTESIKKLDNGLSAAISGCLIAFDCAYNNKRFSSCYEMVIVITDSDSCRKHGSRKRISLLDKMTMNNNYKITKFAAFENKKIVAVFVKKN